MPLPALLPRDEIHDWLQIIFPAGTPHRNYCIRELAASTVFAALHVGAIEGAEVFFGPKHVYRMTNKQALRADDASRKAYAAKILGAGFQPPGRRWYSDNTREPIRDETLREGFVAVGAVIEKSDVPTTSSKPRYALAASFAALFDPVLTGKPLDRAVTTWQKTLSIPVCSLELRSFVRGLRPGAVICWSLIPTAKRAAWRSGQARPSRRRSSKFLHLAF